VAAKVGITPRAAQSILNDLEATGHIQRERVGRRNPCAIPATTHVRRPLETHVRTSGLQRVLVGR
jgi:predicted ArsR family transcriptional regulator